MSSTEGFIDQSVDNEATCSRSACNSQKPVYSPPSRREDVLRSKYPIWQARTGQFCATLLCAGVLAGCGSGDTGDVVTARPPVVGTRPPAPQKVFVQIVNDSDHKDEQTYVLFDTPTTNPPPVVDGIEVLGDSSRSTGQSQLLSSLASTTVITSPSTGEVRKV